MKPYLHTSQLLLISLFLVAAVAFSSCKKDLVPKNGQPVVLVAGSESNGEVSVAKYWINGQGVELSDGSSSAFATSIFASGNNVYVAGVDGGEPVYWKNNTEIKLPHISVSPARIYNIFVSGREVYVAGSDDGAVYWKNGKEVRLNSVSRSDARSIFVAGKDVYVATMNFDFSPGVYWKNEDENLLEPVEPALTRVGVNVNSIFVSGSNVYVVGTLGLGDRQVPRYWVNGKINELTERPNSFSTVATSVFVANNDIYIAGHTWAFTDVNGYVKQDALYWKNGEAIYITDNNTPNFASANSIYVSGNDVYLSGNTNTGATYWKNGNEVKLTNGARTSVANAIFVIK